MMSDALRAVILGIVEGVTEFLPVSSTGHLLLVKRFFGLGEGSFWDSFIVLIQLGAILAIVVIYFAKLWRVALGMFSNPDDRRFVIGLLVAFLPAVGIGLIDMSGNFLAANPVLQRMLGYTEEEFRNIPLMQITPKEDRETIRLRIVQLLDGRLSEYHVEQSYVRRDGSIVWANASVSVIPGSDGQEPTLVKVFDDITERKRAEDRLLNAQAELAHATRVAMIGELTASIAHEINQPLGAIVNNGDVCLRLVADAVGFGDEMREALSDIVNDANRASAIVATVRALAKRATPAKTLMHFNDVVNDVLALAHRELVQRQIKVRSRVAEDLPMVLADRVQLHQVLLNLVMNAMDAMTTVEEKDRILTIWGHPDKLRGKPAVLIGVQDLGKGFGAEDVDLLFEPFYTTKPRGMGMGLRISRSIVEAHGGRLWAQPNANRGATFLCVLPAGAEGD